MGLLRPNLGQKCHNASATCCEGIISRENQGIGAHEGVVLVMLIILGGLPGCGKSTLAKMLAERLSAVWLRIDSIEQALRDAHDLYGNGPLEMGPQGYMVAYQLAADNLALGHYVIADSVNPLEITRAAWRDVARKTGVKFVEIELICSDAGEHRKRIETRQTSVPNLKLPDWQAVQNRDYQPWHSGQLVLDSAQNTAEQLVGQVISRLFDDGAG
jgi:predicted kinase